MVKISVYLDFVGCDDSQIWDITKSWETMVKMGNAIKNKVNFDQPLCTAKSDSSLKRITEVTFEDKRVLVR